MSRAVLSARVREAAATPIARATLVALLAVLVAVGFVLVFAGFRSRSAQPVPLQQPVTVKRALSSPTAFFGDRVHAEVDVYSDDGVVDPASVRVRSDFRPYRAVSTRLDRTTNAGVTLLRVRTTIACLRRECLPSRKGDSVVQFRPFSVSYRTHGRREIVQVPWGSLQVLSRLPADATARAGVVDTAPPVDPGTRVSPGLARGLLILAAVLLGLVGAVLVVRGLLPRELLARRRRRLSPLELSLLDVETAARLGDEAQRRRALDLLATRLGELPAPSLEQRTRSLAWGPEKPDAELLVLLAGEVRDRTNGGSRR